MNGKIVFIAACSLLALPLGAVVPDKSEMDAACRFYELAFAASERPAPAPFMKTVFEDVADGVTRGRSWRGGAFKLGEKTYTHGLQFNAIKHIVVHAGQPAERFVADVGLDNNDDTQRGALRGQGSVTFQVRLGQRELFASPVMRLKDGARHVDVPLDGASEFEIRVGDGGDGRGWD